MNISERLNTIIHMVRPCSLLADIGCDHGYVCIRTVQTGQAASAIASDVAAGPLQIAADNVRAADLEDRITLILADGLEGIPADALPECIVMTGIGGLLMRRILQTLSAESSDDDRFSKLSQLVLGPQSDIGEVRHFLIDTLRYPIVREVTVQEDGKFYTLLDVQPERTEDGEFNAAGAYEYSESQYMYGKYIDPETADVYRAYLDQQHRILTDAYHGALKGCAFGAAQALQDIKHRLALAEVAQDRIESALVHGKEPSRP